MPIIINILPNVYWLYNNPNNPQSIIDYTIGLRRFTESNTISNIIELDDKLVFWQKSASYINEIKLQMEKDEFTKLFSLLKQLTDIINTSYTNNNPCIISTYSKINIEIGLAIWIYFFNINARLPFDNVIKLMAYKIIGHISLSDSLKKFFAFLNMNQIP